MRPARPRASAPIGQFPSPEGLSGRAAPAGKTGVPQECHGKPPRGFPKSTAVDSRREAEFRPFSRRRHPFRPPAASRVRGARNASESVSVRARFEADGSEKSGRRQRERLLRQALVGVVVPERHGDASARGARRSLQQPIREARDAPSRLRLRDPPPVRQRRLVAAFEVRRLATVAQKTVLPGVGHADAQRVASRAHGLRRRQPIGRPPRRAEGDPVQLGFRDHLHAPEIQPELPPLQVRRGQVERRLVGRRPRVEADARR